MKVLVTGGAGFIGSHTVVELILEGHEPVILDSLVNAKESVFARLEAITGYAVEAIQADVRDSDALDRAMASGSFDAVIHFAGLKAVGESVDRPLDYFDVNVGGSVQVLKAMQRHEIEIFLFSSSATVYGDPETLPIPEHAPLRPPSNPYGRSKLMVEQVLEDLTRAAPHLRLGALRYFNPVGAHESGLIGEDPRGVPTNLMPYIAQVAAEKLPKLAVFGDDYPTPDGTGIRDFIHVVDLAKGHVAALERLRNETGLGVWNLGTGTGTSVLELVAAFERAAGVQVPYEVVGRRAGDVAATYADPSRAQRELGWRAERDIDAMCADTWRWQQYAAGIE
ncbi:MAG: UDP-glucose 4-epimerase GalE [Acidimicrobiia bacterium]|nr:UDP-glucose 4-epimerase GalE [Acidimicrobiia bacterium]